MNGDRLTYTPLQLADELQLPGRDDRARERHVLELRLKYGWPALKIGRAVRFTREHVEEILRSSGSKVTAPAPEQVALPGQTSRSAGRKS